MYDLLQPDNDKLALEHTHNGPSVLNQHAAPLTSPNDFAVLLEEIMGNRTQQLTEFGPKSAKTSFLLSLRVRHKQLHSLLHLVELPAADVLAQNPTQLRMKEGPTLNQELLGFASLVDSFSDSSLEPPYEASKTNMLLQEVNAAVLRCAQRMGAIESYPMPNGTHLRGLLIRYHKRYHSVVRQLEALKKGQGQGQLHDGDGADASSTGSESKLLSLRSLLVALHGDKDKVRESYAQFRRKYSEFVSRKTALQQELIASEEKCLGVSQLLIELQMQSNELKQNESAVRQELESKLIGAENDILETGLREQKLADEAVGLRKEL